MTASSTGSSRTRRDKLRVPTSMPSRTAGRHFTDSPSADFLNSPPSLACLPSRCLHQAQVTNNSKGTLNHQYLKRRVASIMLSPITTRP